jgi:hypothetical protein
MKQETAKSYNLSYLDMSKFLSSSSNFYKDDFEIAQQQELHDYAVILLWKTFMLFAYERIKQTRGIIGDDVFDNEYWNKGSLADSKKNLKLFPIGNVYIYSSLEDDNIIDLIGRMFDLEKNYSQLLKSIKNDRNTAAHVASEILKSKEVTVQKTLDDLIRVVNQIDQAFKVKFLAQINLEDVITRVDSEQHFNYLIAEKVVKAIQESLNYNSTDNLLEMLRNKIYMFSYDSVQMILEALKNGQIANGGYNQALDAGSTYQFVVDLLAESYKKNYDLSFWKKWFLSLCESDQKRFYDIRKSLQTNGVEFTLTEHDYWHEDDDIPF